MFGVMDYIDPKLSFEAMVLKVAEDFKRRSGGLRANKCLVSFGRNPIKNAQEVEGIKVEPAIFVLPGVIWVGIEEN